MEKNKELKSSQGPSNGANEVQNVENSNEEMTIKIQTLDNIFPVTIRKSATVNELKDKIFEATSIPIIKQRLLFQGKWLQNNTEKLKQYKISDETVVHLVAKTLEDGANSQQAQNNNAGSNSNNNSQINYDDAINGFIEIPIIRSNRRGRRRRIPHFDISESFESLHQNITTLQLLQSCKNKFDEQQVTSTKTITPFDFSKSRYEVGQWVDVKDTIDQWLEAQIIQVRGNQVFVHYNGWGNRWDEWIEMSSPRIAAFKTYTLQSNTSVFLCPYPSFVPDANLEPQHRSIDTFYYMEKSLTQMNDLTKMIETMSRLRKKTNSNINMEERMKIRRDDFEETKQQDFSSTNYNKHYSQSQTFSNNNLLNSQSAQSLTHYDYELLFLCSQLVPLMDRTGRLLSDISLHLSHLVLNSNLYPQLLLGYNQNNEISDTLSCTSNYSIYTNEGSSVSGFNPNQQFHNEMFTNLQSTTRNSYSNTIINNSNLYNNSGAGISNTFNNILQNIQNSNQMINNYSNLINNNSSANNSSVNLNNFNSSNTINANNMQTQTNNLTNFSIQPNSFNQQNLNQHGTTQQENLNQRQTNLVYESFPKINLQIPAMLSPGEVALVNGYNPYGDHNIDIYVHTLVTPTTAMRQNNQAQPQESTSHSSNNIQRNSSNYGRTNEMSIQTGVNEEGRAHSNNNINSLFQNNTNMLTNHSSSMFNRNPQNSSNSINQGLNNANNNNLENIMTMISSSNTRHNRNSSIGSETSRDSQSTYPPNINHQINIINNRHTINNNININTNNANQSMTKEISCQTDININSNQKQINEALIDSISNKSERITDKRFCGKSQKSVKSVSDLSDFDHYNEEEPNEYSKSKGNTKFNQNISINTLSKLNDSFHSASVKSFNKNDNEFEEKDEEKN